MIGAALSFGWLTFRAGLAQNALLKWGGAAGSGLLALLSGLLSVFTIVGLVRAYAPRQAPVPDLRIAGTSAQVARGQHLANTFCASCHSPTNDLPLIGGVDLGQDLALPLGSFVSVNLTPAGPLQHWSDGEIFRIIRNGIDPDGRWLMVMAGVRGRNLSDEDIQAVIAYLRSQPAVENPTPQPPDRPNLLGLIMLGAGLIPQGAPPTGAVITAPPKSPTAGYGEYILSYQDCRDCHGEDLRGGVEGQLAPIGPNLAVVKGWTLEQFITTLRTGVDPSGHILADTMPWRNIGRMDDEELTAVYAYLTALP
jgi:mono/diheme cytochrome c family protein